MKTTSRMAALLCTAAFACGGAAGSVASAQTATPDSGRSGTVPGWPGYVAMGAVGGPNIYPPTQTSTGGDDDFGGHPVDVVFKYAGNAGTGDPGIIDAPTNALRMQGDLTAISNINSHATRVAMVEYTGQMSGGVAVDDFTNTAQPDASQQNATYLMARHFISLSADVIAMNHQPIVYNGKKYYGTLIMNSDLLGTVEQNNTVGAVASTLASNPVNTAVDQALCFVTTVRHYTNEFNPNGLTSPPYLGKTYHGGPVGILEQMLADGYPVWSINSAGDVYWNTAINNVIGGADGHKYSQVGKWFNDCIANPTYDGVKYQRPNFANNLEGWVQANNWLIRTFSPRGHVTFGWQDNMWAIGSGYWLHADLSNNQIASTYSAPVTNWLNANAPSAIKTGPLGASYTPDYFAFDRYETDDSSSPGAAALYNARAWDNYVTGIGQISANFNNIPIMMWQIPGSHIPYKDEANPELFAGNAGEYVFSTAPDYFFGDSNLNRKLSDIISGPASSTSTITAVGNFEMNCGSYNCPSGSTYKDFLLNYKGQPNNYDWSKNNGRLAMAAANHVFAILWGGGSTTNVIKNFSNQDDHGWLSNKVITYYQHPTKLPAVGAPVAADHAD